MPRRKYCEHPIKHGKSTRVPKGIKAVSSQLSKFLISQYDVAYTRICWLCPRCHTFESKKMMTHQSMEVNDDESSSDDELMTEGSPVNDDKNDDDAVNVEFNDLNEEEKQNPHMDSGIIAESNDDDESHCDEQLILNRWMKRQVMFSMNSNIRKTKQWKNYQIYSNY